MILRTPLVLAASSLLLAGCAQDLGPATPAVTDNVAVVNGRPISRNTFNHYVQGTAGKAASELTAEQRSALLDNLIRGELVAQATEANGLAARDDTRAVLELSRLTVLQQAAMQNFMGRNEATEEELQAEYRQQVAAMPNTEYRARHILVEDEDAARKIISQLENGANFAQLARRESTDQGSRDSGGELDWFSADRMVRPFSEAVATLKKGQYTRTPVQSQYGWHVIRLEDTREVAAPEFESVRERIVQIVDARKFQAHVDGLLEKAQVEKTL